MSEITRLVFTKDHITGKGERIRTAKVVLILYVSKGSDSEPFEYLIRFGYLHLTENELRHLDDARLFSDAAGHPLITLNPEPYKTKALLIKSLRREVESSAIKGYILDPTLCRPRENGSQAELDALIHSITRLGGPGFTEKGSEVMAVVYQRNPKPEHKRPSHLTRSKDLEL